MKPSTGVPNSVGVFFWRFFLQCNEVSCMRHPVENSTASVGSFSHVFQCSICNSLPMMVERVLTRSSTTSSKSCRSDDWIEQSLQSSISSMSILANNFPSSRCRERYVAVPISMARANSRPKNHVDRLGFPMLKKATS